MKKILMSDRAVQDQIEYEDRCGVNTLLQQIFSFTCKVNVFMLVDDSGKIIDYIVEKKI